MSVTLGNYEDWRVLPCDCSLFELIEIWLGSRIGLW